MLKAYSSGFALRGFALRVPDWRVLVGKRHAGWLGHVARMASSRPAKQTPSRCAYGRIGKTEGLRKNLINRAKASLRCSAELDLRIWAHTAQDKPSWNNLCDGWSASGPAFYASNPSRCPICNKDTKISNILGRTSRPSIHRAKQLLFLSSSTKNF